MFFHFTDQERKVLAGMALVCLIGLSANYTQKVNPRLWSMVNMLEDRQLLAKKDINRTSYIELLQVPRLGPVLAYRIIRYRQKKGRFRQLQQLMCIEGIDKGNFRIIRRYLKVK